MNHSVSATVGALIVVGIRWLDRLIALASTVVLARLLLPADFGIIAMASLVISLIDVLLDLGVCITLVQNKHATQHDFDAAWTLRLLQSALATVIIFLAAESAARYFHDARVGPVVQALAFSVLLSGFENIGIVTFQKQMQFGLEFRFFFVKRISSFLITMVLAWYLHSYWALVAGTVAGRAIAVVLSYTMHPMRPRLSWVSMKPMITFSFWNMMRGVSGYLAENLHRMLVGRRESMTLMGSYALASDISAMPSIELLAPLNRVLFPMFVAAKEDAHELKRIFMLAIAVQALIGVPAGAGLALVAQELVLALLGERWLSTVPFIQIMAGINIVSAVSTSGAYVLLALGRAKIIAIHSWGQVLMFVLLAMLCMPGAGAMAIAVIRLGVAIAGLFSLIYLVHLVQPSWRLGDVMCGIWRPCVASMMMALVLQSLPAMNHFPLLLPLLLKTLLGAVVYGLSVLALWLLSGRQDGAESYLLSKVGSLMKGSTRLIWKR